MSDGEINAYITGIESVSIADVESMLPNRNAYDIDIIMSKICDGLAENINVMRRLNDEIGIHSLDDDIMELLKKYYICVNYLNEVNNSNNQIEQIAHKIIFVKTASGKPYFSLDLDKVPHEVYSDVLRALSFIVNDVNMGNSTKVKFYKNNNLLHKILVFKGFQARIYTTKLKDNILAVIGVSIKKATDDKKIKENLKHRVAQVNEQIKELREKMNDEKEKEKLLEDSQHILDDIINVLNGNFDNSDDIELLFPDDAELDAMVPYDKDQRGDINLDDNLEEVNSVAEMQEVDSPASEKKQSATDAADNEVEEADYPRLSNDDSLDDTSEEVAETQEVDLSVSEEKQSATDAADKITTDIKPVRTVRKTRGLGKKTIARRKITDSLKGLALGDLMEIQNFITKLKMNNELNDSIGTMYDGFRSMTDEQKKEFENNIKFFKHDKVGKHK